jgi:hypothetical protein
MISKEVVPKKLFPEFFQAFEWAEKFQNNFSYLKQKSILDHIKINLATLFFGPNNGEYYILPTKSERLSMLFLLL